MFLMMYMASYNVQAMIGAFKTMTNGSSATCNDIHVFLDY